MQTDTGQRMGNEWVGDGNDAIETNARGWPVLHASDPCDGMNPMTGRPCVRTWHTHYHRDVVGAEWLDDE